MESIFGKMVENIKDNGRMIREMEKEYNFIQMDKKNMKVNLQIERKKDMESLFMKMMENIKDNGRMIR